VYEEEHAIFRDTARRFALREIAPNFERWEEAGIVDRDYWKRGGETGLLCAQAPERYGGSGGDFRLNAIVIEELWYAGFSGPAANFSVHSDVCCGYLLKFGTEDQKRHWLPRMVSGDVVCAIAMTEPGTGSDRQILEPAYIVTMRPLMSSNQPSSRHRQSSGAWRNSIKSRITSRALA